MNNLSNIPNMGNRNWGVHPATGKAASPKAPTEQGKLSNMRGVNYSPRLKTEEQSDLIMKISEATEKAWDEISAFFKKCGEIPKDKNETTELQHKYDRAPNTPNAPIIDYIFQGSNAPPRRPAPPPPTTKPKRRTAPPPPTTKPKRRTAPPPPTEDAPPQAQNVPRGETTKPDTAPPVAKVPEYVHKEGKQAPIKEIIDNLAIAKTKLRIQNGILLVKHGRTRGATKQSKDAFIAAVKSIKNKGGQEKAELLHKLMNSSWGKKVLGRSKTAARKLGSAMLSKEVKQASLSKETLKKVTATAIRTLNRLLKSGTVKYKKSGKTYAALISKEGLKIFDLSTNFSEKSLLGEGSFGIVHGVRNIATGQLEGAYKLARKDSKEAKKDVILEAKMLREIHSRSPDGTPWKGLQLPPHVVRKQSLMSSFDDVGYLGVKYDSDLSDYMSNKAPNIKTKVNASLQLLAGLGTLQKLGISHCDIKPQNVLVKQNKDGTFRFDIADLGGARKTKDRMRDYKTLPTHSPAYFPTNYVDNIRGAGKHKKQITQREMEKVDSYSLGATLYELFTSHLYYNKIKDQDVTPRYNFFNEGIVKGIEKHLNDQGCPPRLSKTIAGLLHTSAQKRLSPSEALKMATEGEVTADKNELPTQPELSHFEDTNSEPFGVKRPSMPLPKTPTEAGSVQSDQIQEKTPQESEQIIGYESLKNYQNEFDGQWIGSSLKNQPVGSYVLSGTGNPDTFIVTYVGLVSDENGKLSEIRENKTVKTTDIQEIRGVISDAILNVLGQDEQMKEFIDLAIKTSEKNGFVKYLSPDDVVQRFNNIKCPKETAIQVKGRYLHANRIKMPDGKTYIAAQAPKLGNEELWWKGILQESGMIIDVSSWKDRQISPEKGGVHNYYPDKNAGPVQVGDLIIECTHQEASYKGMEGLTLSTYTVTDENGQSQEIKRLHYDQWTDYGTAGTEHMLSLTDIVDELLKDVSKPPAIHCRAGVGRSGTLAAAMSNKHLIENGSLNRENAKDQTEKAILAGRRDRNPVFVQTSEQLQSILSFNELCLNRLSS